MTYEEAIQKLRTIIEWEVHPDTLGLDDDYPDHNLQEIATMAVDVLDELVYRMRSLEK